jgi:pimeloyl-ACP methyl ester carboxylesterase/membrane protein DedA with SNARE-associated domain
MPENRGNNSKITESKATDITDKPVAGMQKNRRLRWRFLAVYAALLLTSHIVRTFDSSTPTAGGDSFITTQAIDGEGRTDKTVRVSYKEYRPADGKNHPAVLLLHGSPGSHNDFNSLAPELAKAYRVIALDLPGFGRSTHTVPDYSILAHARYVIELMNSLGIERAHILGFSMGGGVALNLADIAPERVASITMLSSIGVQEMELLGDYHLNHSIHGFQLVGLWMMRELTPHFGWLDDAMLGVPYARNFYDSDQRPLREILKSVEAPMLIIHGERDFLVPIEAAREHYRLVPQSESVFYNDDHFMVFSKGRMLSEPIMNFLYHVESGNFVTRSTASPDRVASSLLPFSPLDVPKATGVAAFVLTLLIITATLVSEDLTSIGVGLMVAQGRITYALGAFACFAGIFFGDVLLFLAGRYLGRPALRKAPIKWFVSERDVEKSSQWFTRKGLVVIAASRFVPGMRLPTYFAAGMLNTSFWWFCLYFFIAGAVWTPALVALSSVLGAEVLKSTLLSGQSIFIKVIAAILIIYFVSKLIVKLSTYRGRRLLHSSWRRLRGWEFWPLWAFYPPVVFYVAYLALKYRSLTLFTLANPAMPESGFINESKIDILRGLGEANGFVARAGLIEAALDQTARRKRASEFMIANNLDYPVVLKPNAGQRGSGVGVIRSDEELDDYLRRSEVDTVIQEYVAGFEFGVFYYRYPEEDRGRIFAITDKRFPSVTGDGKSTLERLILEDERAVCMARFYLNKHEDRLWQTPEKGERVQLVELGTHCRGSMFLDGHALKTAKLEEAIDQISRGYEGFYFGRYDIRTPSIEDFSEGHNFKIIELNGVTSEATSIYDPQNSLLSAYRVLFEQWRIAFEIGAQNRRRGLRPTSVSKLINLMIEYRNNSQSHLN